MKSQPVLVTRAVPARSVSLRPVHDKFRKNFGVLGKCAASVNVCGSVIKARLAERQRRKSRRVAVLRLSLSHPHRGGVFMQMRQAC